MVNCLALMMAGLQPSTSAMMNSSTAWNLDIIHIGLELNFTSEVAFWHFLLPTKSYWSTQTSYGDHICAFAIHTKRRNAQNYADKIYGPWATTPLTTGECSPTKFFTISTTFKQFLETNSSVSGRGKILITNEGHGQKLPKNPCPIFF